MRRSRSLHVRTRAASTRCTSTPGSPDRWAPPGCTLLSFTPATPPRGGRYDEQPRSEHVRYAQLVLEASVRRQVHAAGVCIAQHAREAIDVVDRGRLRFPGRAGLSSPRRGRRSRRSARRPRPGQRAVAAEGRSGEGARCLPSAGVVRAVQRPARAGWRAEAPAWRRSATGYRRLITLCERGALPGCGASAPGRIDRQEPR
jgi:hypothetical protein